MQEAETGLKVLTGPRRDESVKLSGMFQRQRRMRGGQPVAVYALAFAVRTCAGCALPMGAMELSQQSTVHGVGIKRDRPNDVTVPRDASYPTR